jgi:hypothetical protein
MIKPAAGIRYDENCVAQGAWARRRNRASGEDVFGDKVMFETVDLRENYS